MNKTFFVMFAITLSINTQLRADVVGVQFGTSAWTPDYTGSFALNGVSTGTPIDIERDLGFNDQSHSDIWLKIEHPVPVVPNFKIVSSDFDAAASSTLTRDIIYDDQTFNKSSDISTRFDMTNTELTLYYELLDNWFNLDVGLTLRQYDGISRIATATNSASESLDFTVPLLYLDARIDLPYSGFFVDSTMNTVNVDKNVISDINVAIGYESDFGLGARLGYRNLDLGFDEANLDVDLQFKGTYMNLFYHF